VILAVERRSAEDAQLFQDGRLIAYEVSEGRLKFCLQLLGEPWSNSDGAANFKDKVADEALEWAKGETKHGIAQQANEKNKSSHQQVSNPPQQQNKENGENHQQPGTRQDEEAHAECQPVQQKSQTEEQQQQQQQQQQQEQQKQQQEQQQQQSTTIPSTLPQQRGEPQYRFDMTTVNLNSSRSEATSMSGTGSLSISSATDDQHSTPASMPANTPRASSVASSQAHISSSSKESKDGRSDPPSSKHTQTDPASSQDAEVQVMLADDGTEDASSPFEEPAPEESRIRSNAFGAMSSPRAMPPASPQGAQIRSLLGRYQSTPPNTCTVSLQWALLHWNIPVNSRMCCPWHNALTVALRLLSLRESTPCNHRWKPLGGWQCRRCGSMNHEAIDACDMCRETRDGVGAASAGGGSRSPSIASTRVSL